MNMKLTEEEAKNIEEALSDYWNKMNPWTFGQEEEIKQRNENPEYAKEQRDRGLSTPVLVEVWERAEKRLSIAKSLLERLKKKEE